MPFSIGSVASSERTSPCKGLRRSINGRGNEVMPNTGWRARLLKDLFQFF